MAIFSLCSVEASDDRTPGRLPTMLYCPFSNLTAPSPCQRRAGGARDRMGRKWREGRYDAVALQRAQRRADPGEEHRPPRVGARVRRAEERGDALTRRRLQLEWPQVL